eukprot:TRINITY_DN1792_c0_g1_i2.p1 TRINITY_DN1792_c0_g1~~TRINITY_DN1792_c0_g1_i2.p1  ORF type:complete len:242 (-),score=38.70 TRINITY_DN1792_c0_g1_i2:26-751(-)
MEVINCVICFKQLYPISEYEDITKFSCCFECNGFYCESHINDNIEHVNSLFGMKQLNDFFDQCDLINNFQNERANYYFDDNKDLQLTSTTIEDIYDCVSSIEPSVVASHICPACNMLTVNLKAFHYYNQTDFTDNNFNNNSIEYNYEITFNKYSKCKRCLSYYEGRSITNTKNCAYHSGKCEMTVDLKGNICYNNFFIDIGGMYGISSVHQIPHVGRWDCCGAPCYHDIPQCNIHYIFLDL